MFPFREKSRVVVWQTQRERSRGYMAISRRRFSHRVWGLAAMAQEEASQRRLRRRYAMRRAICRIWMRRVTQNMGSQKPKLQFSLTCHAETAIRMEVAVEGPIIPVATQTFPDHAGVRQMKRGSQALILVPKMSIGVCRLFLFQAELVWI